MSTAFARLGAPLLPPGIAPGAHAVQFYGHDAQLLDRVADYVGPALEGREAAIVIATKKLRDHLGAELRSRGIDLRQAEADGQYVAIDAASTLARFVVGGRPDADRFADTVGTLLDRTAARFDHVRAYGEMVALLWLAGRPSAALELEELWNDLRAKRMFTLLCGYPVECFRGPAQAGVGDVASTHTDVATESYDRRRRTS